MLSLLYLELWFKDIWRINFDLGISLTNIKRLQEIRYPCEERTREFGFFAHHSYQLQFIMIIQIAKLLDNNDNQQRNFHKLCNCLSGQKYGPDLRAQLRLNQEANAAVFKSIPEVKEAAQHIRSGLSSLTPIIDKVVELRDKVYAHKDRTSPEANITLEELNKLVNFCFDSYNLLVRGILNKDTDFSTGDWSVDEVLKGFSENIKDRIERIFSRAKKNN